MIRGIHQGFFSLRSSSFSVSFYLTTLDSHELGGLVSRSPGLNVSAPRRVELRALFIRREARRQCWKYHIYFIGPGLKVQRVGLATGSTLSSRLGNSRGRVAPEKHGWRHPAFILVPFYYGCRLLPASWIFVTLENCVLRIRIFQAGRFFSRLGRNWMD